MSMLITGLIVFLKICIVLFIFKGIGVFMDGIYQEHMNSAVQWSLKGRNTTIIAIIYALEMIGMIVLMAIAIDKSFSSLNIWMDALGRWLGV